MFVQGESFKEKITKRNKMNIYERTKNNHHHHRHLEGYIQIKTVLLRLLWEKSFFLTQQKLSIFYIRFFLYHSAKLT